MQSGLDLTRSEDAPVTDSMQDESVAGAHTRPGMARAGSGHQDEGFERIEKKLVDPVVADRSLAIAKRLEPGLRHGGTLSGTERLARAACKRPQSPAASRALSPRVAPRTG